MANRKLSDEEVCLKFGVTRDSPSFPTARGLSDNRPDRVICDVPELHCPHCTHKFTATYNDIEGPGIEIPCPGCERIMFVEHIVAPDDEDFDGTITVTLCTHDPRETD
jgi:hypothetical protein